MYWWVNLSTEDLANAYLNYPLRTVSDGIYSYLFSHMHIYIYEYLHTD